MLQLKYLLSDTESLAHYNLGKFVSFGDVKRRMFLKAREYSRIVPDSYYLLAQEKTFLNIDSICEIFTKGLMLFSKEYFDFVEGKVFVKSYKQTEWQELITYIPPLFFQCSFLQNKVLADSSDLEGLRTLVTKYLLPNTRYTAIPSTRIPQLDYYLMRQRGLHDLHMHLNGSLETDQVWQDYLFSPDSIHSDLTKAFSDQKVKEQFEQESTLLEPRSYVSLLHSARKLRNYFYDYIFGNDNLDDCGKYLSKNQLLQVIINNDSKFVATYQHPFLELVSSDNNYDHLMTVEALMYLLILTEIQKTHNETLASLFHFYLLILGLTNRLLVQQTHQNGFDQFQKHTLNGLRENSERIYRKRYFQMHGNDRRNLHFLEGRFSPKKSEAESISLIDGIWDGWEAMCSNLKEHKDAVSAEVFDSPTLKLIAHFIKRREKTPDDFVRHKELRDDIWQRGKILGLLITKYPKYNERVSAVDAAANEFDAPPEVFAPVFRLMRRYGVKHFTYHAGEDFYHIPGGLRAVYEAIMFCDLKNGDRIGHATATGLSVGQWSRVFGSKILIRQGDYLDDLVFIYHLIVQFNVSDLHRIIPFLTNRIHDLSFEIYKEYYPVTVLEKAWLMRQCCPIHLLEEKKESAELKQVFNEHEWLYPLDAGLISERNNISHDKTWMLFQRYHDKKYRASYQKIIEIDPFEIVEPSGVELLQMTLLGEMNKREIVIETLPTSNVRIGFHKDFSTYHLYNWIKWREEGKSIPPIVVGSDDTGIFATNIYNEYANIYSMLLCEYKMPHSKVLDVVKKLDEDSRIYRFQ